MKLQKMYEPSFHLLQRYVFIIYESLFSEVKDENKRAHFRKKTEEYLARAEAMKEAAAKLRTLGKTHRQVSTKMGQVYVVQKSICFTGCVFFYLQ